MRVAVVGHVEWVEFLHVERVPARGEIVHAFDPFALPGGGGGVAAVTLARAAEGCTLFTALGDDELGHRAHDELVARGVRVHATFRPEPQRRAVTHIDATGERSITVVGDRLGPVAADPLPWEELAAAGAVFATQADAPVIRLARRSPVLVATSRIVTLLREAGVRLDALVGSASDPAEAYAEGAIDPEPALVIRTDGDRGGRYTHGGATLRYAPASLDGPVVDRYGAGDTFAAIVTLALGEGDGPAPAIERAARAAADSITRRGPYD